MQFSTNQYPGKAHQALSIDAYISIPISTHMHTVLVALCYPILSIHLSHMVCIHGSQCYGLPGRACSSSLMDGISTRSLYAFLSLYLYTAATVARALALLTHALNLTRIMSLYTTRPPTQQLHATHHTRPTRHTQRARSTRPISIRFRGGKKNCIAVQTLHFSLFRTHLCKISQVY